MTYTDVRNSQMTYTDVQICAAINRERDEIMRQQWQIARLQIYSIAMTVMAFAFAVMLLGVWPR